MTADTTSPQTSAPSAPRPADSRPTIHRVRVVLEETDPPLWRRLDLAGDLRLDDLHDVLQVAFGWTDSHLHRFSTGDWFDADSRFYLCPFDVVEGDEGTPEEQVRVDEVLAEPGDRLHYQYDYGDNWWHTLEVEQVHPRPADQPAAVCVDGERPGPPEDCGGVEGYELSVAAADPAHPDHDAAAVEFTERYGIDVSAVDLGVVPFDRDAVNAELDALGLADRPDPDHVPQALNDLLRRIGNRDERHRLRRLIAAAHLEVPAEVEAEVAARMVAPYRWLLERVGAEGIRLTSAGYLPPAHVRAAFDELGLDEEWIGAGNREADTLPVLHLRESAQAMGLLRKHRGRLDVTRRGRQVVDDPVALWAHVAERMPVDSRDGAERHAGLALLLAAAGEDELAVVVADVLALLGWRSRDTGAPLTPSAALSVARNDLDVLRRIGALTRERGARWPGRPTPEGAAFARAALQTWPR